MNQSSSLGNVNELGKLKTTVTLPYKKRKGRIAPISEDVEGEESSIGELPPSYPLKGGKSSRSHNDAYGRGKGKGREADELSHAISAPDRGHLPEGVGDPSTKPHHSLESHRMISPRWQHSF